MVPVNATHSPIPYVRLHWRAPAGRTRWAWAREFTRPGAKLRRFALVDSTGEPIGEVLLTAPGDILSERQARVHLKYGELEIVQ